jgi:hypothetical protein
LLALFSPSFSVSRPSLVALSVAECLTFSSSETTPRMASAAFFGLLPAC